MGQFKDFYIKKFEEEVDQERAKIINMSIDMPVRPEGANLLHLAAACADLEDVQFLLEKGANPNAYDPDGDQPLYFAACTNNPKISNDEIIAVIDALLDAGASIDHQNRYGCSALHGTTMSGDMRFDVLKHLIERGANFKAKDIRQNTLASFAASQGCSKDVVFYLIDKGIDVEELYNDGTVLYLGDAEAPTVVKRSEARECYASHSHDELNVMRLTPGHPDVEALWS